MIQNETGLSTQQAIQYLFHPLEARREPGDPRSSGPTPPPVPPGPGTPPGGGIPPPSRGGGGSLLSSTNVEGRVRASRSTIEIDDGDGTDSDTSDPDESDDSSLEGKNISKVDTSSRDFDSGLVMPSFGFPEMNNDRFRLLNPDSNLGAAGELAKGSWKLVTGRPFNVVGAVGFFTQRPALQSVAIGVAVGAVTLFALPEAAVVEIAAEAGIGAWEGWSALMTRISTAAKVGGFTTKAADAVRATKERFEGYHQMSDAIDRIQSNQDHTPGSQRSLLFGKRFTNGEI